MKSIVGTYSSLTHRRCSTKCFLIGASLSLNHTRKALPIQNLPQARSLGHQGGNNGVFPKHDAKVINAAPAAKAPKYYPAEDVKKPLINKCNAKPTKLRNVFMLLAGRYKGKRVVFLKQLTSGLLLVTAGIQLHDYEDLRGDAGCLYLGSAFLCSLFFLSASRLDRMGIGLVLT